MVDGLLQQHPPVAMDPGSRFAWPGRQPL